MTEPKQEPAGIPTMTAVIGELPILTAIHQRHYINDCIESCEALSGVMERLWTIRAHIPAGCRVEIDGERSCPVVVFYNATGGIAELHADFGYGSLTGLHIGVEQPYHADDYKVFEKLARFMGVAMPEACLRHERKIAAEAAEARQAEEGDDD